ncbi:hypothetical protein EG329_012539 [Mollisiaceae sp. DMI_Dod_QoI]|nr:hypothetical protein EG329_012539 [Helotiales sp. DMI_Dod_QoI]
MAMNNPPLQPTLHSNIPMTSSIPETGSTDTWGSEASNEESDEGEVDLFEDEGCADEAFWEDDTAANAWLARFPGGTSVLYPHLFLVKPRDGRVLTPPRYPNNDTLLHLPSEIRNRIYTHYFDEVEEVKHSEERHAPFRDREGIEMQRICIGSDNVELKFWLSTALLQTSRQLRFEAMSVLFGSRVITVEWLPVLPRLVKFLAKEGCAMVRYLDIWDTLNLQEEDNAVYRDIITSIRHFPGLQHLRIVVSCGVLRARLWNDRTYSWFDPNEWRHGKPTEQALPKMRSEDIEKHWPEYEVLKTLKAQKFTLAVDTPWVDKYLEFDRSQGAYPGISKSMQSHATCTQSPPSSVDLSTSTSPQVLEAFADVKIQTRSSASTLTAGFDDEDSDGPTWQETDSLVNKTIPIYNFLREFFHNNLLLGPAGIEMSEDNFVAFPTARKSTGSIMQDCAFCYLNWRHCGYHAVPDQPPFEITRLLEGDDEEEDVETLQRRFENLSYVDMREVSQGMVEWMKHADAKEFLNITAIFDYLGWPEAPNSERLARLDAAVEVGWTGRRVDKDEVPAMLRVGGQTKI